MTAMTMKFNLSKEQKVLLILQGVFYLNYFLAWLVIWLNFNTNLNFGIIPYETLGFYYYILYSSSFSFIVSALLFVTSTYEEKNWLFFSLAFFLVLFSGFFLFTEYMTYIVTLGYTTTGSL